MYRVFKAPKFQKKVEKLLDKKELDELEKFINDLKKGNIKGKPLGFSFFREKKIGGKRVYFLVYKEITIILLVSSSDKRYQKETINEIKYMLPEFRRYVYEIYIKFKKK